MGWDCFNFSIQTPGKGVKISSILDGHLVIHLLLGSAYLTSLSMTPHLDDYGDKATKTLGF